MADSSDRIDPYVWRIAIVVVLGSIMSILDTTIVNVALQTLHEKLHSSLSDIQWVITGYLLSLATVIPLTGWSSRRFGAKRVYLFALVLFTAGSALCGVAGSTNGLIAFRVLQGLGGGLIMPVRRHRGPQADGARDERDRSPDDARPDPRTDDRRADPLRRELALDLLRQCPDRDRRRRPGAADPAGERPRGAPAAT
jgi:hypothetical protein